MMRFVTVAGVLFAVVLSIAPATPAEAQSQRSGARVVAGLAVSAVGALVMVIKPQAETYSGNANYSGGAVHRDWRCGWNRSVDTSSPRRLGFSPVRMGNYCGLYSPQYITEAAGFGRGVQIAGHPAGADNGFTQRIQDNTSVPYSGTVGYRGSVTPAISTGQRLAGAALIGAGVMIAAVLSEVPAVRDVDLQVDRDGFRANKTFGW